jgi:hypothetical protein
LYKRLKVYTFVKKLMEKSDKKTVVYPIRMEQDLYDEIFKEACKRNISASNVMRERLKSK